MNNVYCMSGHLFLTAMGRITLDNHNCETYVEPADKILMTADELRYGIKASELVRRLKVLEGDE